VAQGISDDSYGLIFGINRFFSLSLQSTLTFVVNDEKGLALGERTQFMVYGVYFGCLGVLFGATALVTFCKSGGPSSDSIASHPSEGCKSETNSIESGRINQL
jgi:hypothetical protein